MSNLTILGMTPVTNTGGTLVAAAADPNAPLDDIRITLPQIVVSFSWRGGSSPNAQAWRAPQNLTIVSVVGRVEIAEGGASTVQPVIVQPGTSISAGVTLTTGAFNGNGTVAADQTLALIATPAVAEGDWIGLVSAGGFTTNQGNITFTAVPT